MSRVGIEHHPIDLPADTGPVEFARTLDELNADRTVTGVLVLMPLPARLSPALVHEHLSPLKDVDGITPTNAGRLHMGLPSLRPSTPQGGLELLDHYGVELEGRRVAVIGRSNVVGRPFASLLTQRNATVTVCHRRTVDLPRMTRCADIVASAAGHAGLVTAAMVKPGAVVLDFGVNVVDDRIVGDVAFDDVFEVAGGITPVPGGTGPVTALVLARNTVAAGFVALSGSLDHVDLVKALGTPASSLAE
jgi:methylenetetrahydrofolate dehydrogenase (NADP+)/methenyltetrahydrofolate cyclohydrolase